MSAFPRGGGMAEIEEPSELCQKPDSTRASEGTAIIAEKAWRLSGWRGPRYQTVWPDRQVPTISELAEFESRPPLAALSLGQSQLSLGALPLRGSRLTLVALTL